MFTEPSNDGRAETFAKLDPSKQLTAASTFTHFTAERSSHVPKQEVQELIAALAPFGGVEPPNELSQTLDFRPEKDDPRPSATKRKRA